MRLLFITIAEQEIGYGHLSRCLALAEHASKGDLSASFLLFGDTDAYSRIKHAGYDCLLEPLSRLNSRFAAAILSRVEAADAVVADFSHSVVLSDLEGARQILEHIRGRARRIIVIDALGEQTLAKKIPEMPIDVLVAPYVGATIPDSTIWRTLSGPAYAVLSLAYAGLAERTVSQGGNRILVSCGGSDPTKLTPIVLEGIERVPGNLNVRVIVGPLFDTNLKAVLRSVASVSKHNIALIDAPDGLAKHMLWCDLAIATSGLIKYELAATSTPGILLSIDASHDLINRPFDDIGSTLHLGTGFTPQLIADHVTNLLGDHAARVHMAAAGRRLIDGKGGERIIAEIIGSCRAKD